MSKNTTSIINKDGFPFEFNQIACSSCSAKCCSGISGNVWVNAIDIRNICNMLEINIFDGVNKFFEKRENRYSIRECFDGREYRCIFLDNYNRCSIYKVRPFQCQTFPFWEYFKRNIDKLICECPGIKRISC
ncbi:MAG: YkgJ family cysteine cluster protein [Desulfamplus sp.]|nr:YkgJ family cysteine cluster protein [Desulfamplus sp.]